MVNNVVLFICTYFAFMFILFIWYYLTHKQDEAEKDLKEIKKTYNQMKKSASHVNGATPGPMEASGNFVPKKKKKGSNK